MIDFHPKIVFIGYINWYFNIAIDNCPYIYIYIHIRFTYDRWWISIFFCMFTIFLKAKWYTISLPEGKLRYPPILIVKYLQIRISTIGYPQSWCSIHFARLNHQIIGAYPHVSHHPKKTVWYSVVPPSCNPPEVLTVSILNQRIHRGISLVVSGWVEWQIYRTPLFFVGHHGQNP